MSTAAALISDQQAIDKLAAAQNALTDKLAEAPLGIAPTVPQMAELLEGRRRIGLNAIKSNVTGRKMFLTQDEFPIYMALARDFMLELKPATVRDTQLAQKLIDINWRMSRIAILENNFHMTGVLKRSDDPTKKEDSQEIIAEVLAFEADCSGDNALDKLGRHEMRLTRMADQLETTYERRKKRRSRMLGAKPEFDPATHPAYRWYKSMAALGEDLVAARQELDNASRTQAATQTESNTSAPPLFCKNEIPKLTELTILALTFAQEIGLLSDDEVLLFNNLRNIGLPARPGSGEAPHYLR
jgi:uncharacterized coiled-coil protein SlyX